MGGTPAGKEQFTHVYRKAKENYPDYTKIAKLFQEWSYMTGRTNHSNP